MADWRKNGFVPDSDDEEEWGLGESQESVGKLGSQLGLEGSTVDAGPQAAGIPVEDGQGGSGIVSGGIETEADNKGIGMEGAVETFREQSPPPCPAKSDGLPTSNSPLFGTPAEFKRSDIVEVLDLTEMVEMEEEEPLHGTPGDSNSAADAAIAPSPPQRDMSTTPRPRPIASQSSSSPLSDPPSNISTPTASPVQSPTARGRVPFSIVLPQPSHPPAEWSPTAISPDFNDSDDFTSGPLRNLRQRKPIQLNPYQIEQARYRQTLKARGVRPINIQAEKSQENGPTEEAEQEYNASADEEESQPRARSNRQETPRAQDSLIALSTETSMNTEQDEYDLPDVHTLLWETGRKGDALPSGSVKRRKITHTYSHKNRASGTGWVKLVTEPQSATPKSRPSTDSRQYSTPSALLAETNLSDGSSPVRPSQRRPLAHRSLNTLSPRHIQLISSEDDDTPPQSSIRRGTRTQTTPSPVASEHSSLESDAGIDIDIRRLQKRTNGVLPASWWKLDQKRQTATEAAAAKRRLDTQSPTRNVNRPGVARAKISKNRREVRENIGNLNLDGDSSTQSEESDTGFAVLPMPSSRPHSSGKGSSPQRRLGWLALDDDIMMEDDRIDPMLQKSYGRKKQSKLKVSRTKKSKNTGETESVRNNGGSSSAPKSSTRAGESRATKSTTSRKSGGRAGNIRRPRKVAPRLSVLDAYEHHHETFSNSPPQFLKIARRTAKKKSNKALTGPEGKMFVLDTQADTLEVQSVLHQWREGTLDVVAYARKKYPDREVRSRRFVDQGAEVDDMGVGDMRVTSSPYSHGATGAPSNAPLYPLFRPNGSQPHKLARKKQTTLLSVVQKQPPLSMSGSWSTGRDISKGGPKARQRQTFLRPDIIGPGQLETTSGEFYRRPPVIQAPIPLIDILRQKKPSRPAAFHHPSLGKFLEDDDMVVNPLLALKRLTAKRAPHSSSHMEMAQSSSTAEIPPIPRPNPGGRRKRPPRRIDADTKERRQPPPEHTPLDFDETQIIHPVAIELGLELAGLAPYGTRYSLNFDTQPFKPGTIFNSETFIGSGEFPRALSTPVGGGRANSTMSSSFTYEREHIQWGVYCDRVSSDFETVMESLMDRMDKAFEQTSQDDVDLHMLATQANSFYRFTCSYVAKVLHFSDSIDVVSFSQRFLKVLENCSNRVSTAFSGVVGRPDLKLPSIRMGIQTLWFILMLLWQLFCICGRNDGGQRNPQLENAIKISAKALISKLIKCGFEPVRQCYEDQRIRSQFEKGIGNDAYVMEAWVIAIRVLHRLNSPVTTFWKLFNTELHIDDLGKVADATIYEQCWKALFSLLPLFQFDVDGIVGHNSMAEDNSVANWDLLKKLATVLFKHYQDNPDQAKINDYIRIIYTRTQHLITKWHWPNSEAMIATLFGFFAGNGFSNLRNEFDHSSPSFLQNLEGSPSLQVEDSDRCFHILLKLIAGRIFAMRENTDTRSATRKIQSFVFRLMPNHRRHYPKEDDLRLEYLTALRNHHDLLCTLYWASPSNCRPPLTVIRDLVDPATSHIQACTVSIRAWSFITRFQAHADEDLAAIDPLMEWFEDVITQTLNQHNACRAEARKQFLAEKGRGNVEISEEDLEDTIRRNQRQLEVLLLEGLRLLGTLMKSVKTKLLSAMKLFTPAATGTIFSAFNSVSPKLVNEALNVLTAYLDVCQYTPPPVAAGGVSQVLSVVTEESQEYGDFSGMEDLVIEGEKKAAAEHLVAVAYEPLLRMVLSAFGAEQQPADTLLVHLLDSWVRVVGFLVQKGLKSWDTFLGGYSHESWLSFPETEQKNKFTAYYMASLVTKYNECYAGNKNVFMSLWLKTLVERKSMLKYQNELTNALLNIDPQNPILYNLPFTRRDNGLYNISLTEFETRRISVISTVLSNMRISYDSASSFAASALRKEYSTMLQLLMTSMRDTYLTLRDPQDTARTNVYVAFVQQVIELLQQHAIDIVPIDKFFTDSSAFPLPATDPTYVIGKLKNYGLKLAMPRTYKQLLAFFHTVSERAAIDGQQEYLVDQLTRALTGETEGVNGAGAGDSLPPPPTLRGFFLQAVFPVYIENAFYRGNTHQIPQPRWILAVPVALAARRIVERVREDFDSCSYTAVREVVRSLAAWAEAGRRALARGMHENGGVKGLVNVPELVMMMVLLVDSVTPCLPVLDWLLDGARRRCCGRGRGRGIDDDHGMYDDDLAEGYEEQTMYEGVLKSVTALVNIVGGISRELGNGRGNARVGTSTPSSLPQSPMETVFPGFHEEQEINPLHPSSPHLSLHKDPTDPFRSLKDEHAQTLLAQEWIPSVDFELSGQWICARRPVSSTTTGSWKRILLSYYRASYIGGAGGGSGDDGGVDYVALGKEVLGGAVGEFLATAARAEMAWRVVREVDEGSWGRERERGGRWAARGTRPGGGVAAGAGEVLFC